MQSSYSDDDSDYTEEETFVMLNFPQLNFDESKLKMLNTVRKRETSETNENNENDEDICDYAIATSDEEKSEKLYSPQKTSDKVSSIDITNCYSNIKKNAEKVLITDVEQKNQILETPKVDGNEKEKKKEKKKEKEKTKKGKKKPLKEFPFEIKSISLKNLFSENPQCIMNNKYKFTGIQTSSIGTNFFFKEPEGMKKGKDSENENIFYDCVYKKEMKNENTMSREDFAIYEGHSRKIISFEIDY